jgi:hypothetical protein
LLITVSFKRAERKGAEADPGPGECTWIDRPMDGAEPTNFTMPTRNVFSFKMTGAGQIENEGGRAQFYCESHQEERFCDVVQAILEFKPFIVNVNNDGRTLVASSARFSPFLAFLQFQGNIRPGEPQTGTLPGGVMRAYHFVSTGNDSIKADVRFPGGQAIAFLTDLKLGVIAQGDAAAPDGRIEFRVPSGPSRSMFIIFKEKNRTTAPYTVRLSIAPGSCSADPGAETWRTYLATTQEECSGFPGNCPSGQIAFSNRCGCGCERPNPGTLKP